MCVLLYAAQAGRPSDDPRERDATERTIADRGQAAIAASKPLTLVKELPTRANPGSDSDDGRAQRPFGDDAVLAWLGQQEGQINLSDVVGALHRFGIDQADRAVELVLEVVALSNGLGKPVVIRNFGRWEPRTRGPVTRSNPKTGRPVRVPAKAAVGFVAAPAFKRLLNEPLPSLSTTQSVESPRGEPEPFTSKAVRASALEGSNRQPNQTSHDPASQGPGPHRMPATGSSPTAKVPSEFGLLLRELRDRRNLTQKSVANLAKVSAGYIGLIEAGDRGQRPSLDFVTRVAEALNASVPERRSLLRASGHLGAEDLSTPDEAPTAADLPPPVERPTFAQFVKADPALNKRQRKILVGLYESWFGRS